MAAPAPVLPAIAPAEPEHVYHCGTCVCDPTSPRAREEANRAEPLVVTRSVRWLIALIDPEFFAWLHDWWTKARHAGHRHPAKVVVEFHALKDEILPRWKPAPPPDRTFRRKRGA